MEEKDQINVGIPHRCNLQAFEDALEGNFWLDLREELDGWLEDIHLMLEDADGLLSDKDLHRLGGSAQAIRNFMDLPAIMLANAKADREEL